MARTSTALAWCIRWETIERVGDQPLFDGELPEPFDSHRTAEVERQRLTEGHPRRPRSPFAGGDSQPVQYFVFARRLDDESRMDEEDEDLEEEDL